MKRKHSSVEAESSSDKAPNPVPEPGPSTSKAFPASGPESATKPASASSTASDPAPLSRAQRAQIERNRQRALMLRQARLRDHPAQAALDGGCDGRVLRIQGSRVVDSGGGFFIDEPTGDGAPALPPPLKQKPAPLHITSRPNCDECDAPVASSFLVDSFEWPVCDACHKENSDKYSLITRTEAKQEYILKDEDFDKREPELRFITRRNPHNPRWGEMKLYLRMQIEERALEVWGSEEELERQHELREKKKDKIKVNKFNKRVKELRMSVRSSVYKRKLTGHEHTFGEEVYNEEDDTYTRTCTECDHPQTYEKM